MGRIKYTVYIEEEQADKVKELSTMTRVPQSAYLREAIDDLITKYEKKYGKGFKKAL